MFVGETIIYVSINAINDDSRLYFTKQHFVDAKVEVLIISYTAFYKILDALCERTCCHKLLF